MIKAKPISMQGKALLLLFLIALVGGFQGTAIAADEDFLIQDLPEVVVDTESVIYAKAQELGNDPVQIYEFVRNEFEFQNYVGLMKGPEQTLLSGGGNDYDLSALLVSLLRSAGVPSRFVRGRIEITDEQAMALTGATSGLAALKHIDIDPVPEAYWPTRDGGAGTIEMLHIWVEAKVDMARYRGASDGAGSSNTVWVPLDAAFKLSDWSPLPVPAIPFTTHPDLAFDYDEYLSKVQTKRPIEIFETVVQRYLANSSAETDSVRAVARTVDDISFIGKIRRESPGVLPNALPYKLIKDGTSGFEPLRSALLVDLHVPPISNPYPADIPSATSKLDYLYYERVHVCSQALTDPMDCLQLYNSSNHKVLAVDGYSADWEGKRVTLSFLPLPTQEDLIPDDGFASCQTVTKPDGTTDSLWAYPIVKVDGVKASGLGLFWNPVTENHEYHGNGQVKPACQDVNIVYEIYSPRGAPPGVMRNATTVGIGGTYIVGTNSWTASPQQTKKAFEAVLAAEGAYPIEFDADNEDLAYIDADHSGGKNGDELYFAQDFVAQEALTGGLLHLATTWWYEQHYAGLRRLQQIFHQLPYFFPNTGIVSAGVESDYAFDVPLGSKPQNPVLDLKGLAIAWASRATGEMAAGEEAITVSRLSSSHVSALEHMVWERLAANEAVSTVKGMQLGQEAYGRHLQTITSAAEAQALIDLAAKDAESYYGYGHVPCHVDEAGTVLCDGWLSAFEPTAWRAYGHLRYPDGVQVNNVYYLDVPEPQYPGDYAPTLAQRYASGSYRKDRSPEMYDACETLWGEGNCRIFHPYMLCQVAYAFNVTNNDLDYCDDYGVDLSVPSDDTTTQFWILDNPIFSHHGFDGTVYYHEYESALDGSRYFNQVLTPGSAGGSEATWAHTVSYDSIWSNPDPFGWGVNPFDDIYGNNGLITSDIGISWDDSGWDADPVSSYMKPPDIGMFSTSHEFEDTAGDPVSIAKGNYFDRKLDINIPGPGGMNLRMLRSYTSRSDREGALGHGWVHTYEQHLKLMDFDDANPGDERIVWIDEGGAEMPWDDHGSTGAFESREWNHDELVRNEDGTYTLTTAVGLVYVFHADADDIAKLNYIEDRNGNRITCNYDGTGLLDSVTDAAGRVLDFTYDGNDKLSTIKDWRSAEDGGQRTWSYTVNAAGDLEKYIDPVEMAKLNPDDRKAWEYEYFTGLGNENLNHNLMRFSKPEDRNGDGTGRYSMEFEYYTNDKVYKHTDSLGNETVFQYNEFNGRTDVTHPDGGVETHFYDPNLNVVRYVSPEGRVEENEYDSESKDRTLERDPFGFETTMTHDGNGNLRSKTDHFGFGETWAHNEFGQVISYTNRLGDASRSVYDESGNLLRKYSEINGKEELLLDRSYDEHGNLIEETGYALPNVGGAATTRWEYDADGVHPIRITDPMGNAVRFEYDSVGNVIEVSRERNIVENGKSRVVVDRVAQEVDELGRAVSSINSAGVESQVVYDANGLTKESHTLIPQFPGPGAVDRADSQVTYDVLDRAVSVKNALGDEVITEYDSMGRAIRVTSPSGSSAYTEYDLDGNPIYTVDPVGAETFVHYDIMGRAVRTTDALGRETRVEYDYKGRVLRTYGPGETGEVLLSEMEYDANGNPTSVKDAENHETNTEYDEFGRPKSVVVEIGTIEAPMTATTAFTYDLAGRMLSRTDAESNTISVRYDRLGRAIEIKDALGHPRYATYDEAGNLIRAVDPNGEQIDFEYDEHGRLRRQVGRGVDAEFDYDPLGRLVMGRNSEAWLATEYDDLDRPISVTDSQAGTWRHVYDEDGRVVQKVLPNDLTYGFSEGVVISYQYDKRGQLISVTDPTAGSWRFEHDAIGRLVRRTDPSGIERTVEYTNEGFANEVELLASDDSLLERYSYSGYDKLGNPEFIDATIFIDETTGVVSEQTQVLYDALSRVTNVAYGDTESETFGYDKVGNRTTHVDRTGQRRTYELNGAYQLNQIVDTDDSSTIFESFTYDNAGNRKTHSVANTLEDTYDYDAAGKLIGGQKISSEYSYELGYGPGGNRYRRTDTTSGDSFYFGGSLEHRNGEAIRMVRAGGQVLAEISSSSTRGLFYDAGNNVTRVEHGTTASTRKYETFGDVRQETVPAGTERGFASSLAEGASGLYYMGARHYDPATGRFLQSDPAYISTNDLYAYASGNPYRFWDPSGLSSQGYNSSSSSGYLSSSYEYSGSSTSSSSGSSYGASAHQYSPSTASAPTQNSSGITAMSALIATSNFASGVGSTLSFGLTDVFNDWSGAGQVVNKESGWRKGGEWTGTGLSLAFGVAHLGRNAVAQMGARGTLGTRVVRGAKSLFSKDHTWGHTRSTWSKAMGGLKPKGQSLHHWLFTQRGGAAQGLRNAGFNYLPISARFNSYMNGSTAMRQIVELGFRGSVLNMYASPAAMLGSRLFGGGDE